MRNFLILLSMIVCLFGPTAIFTVVGYKSMKTLSNRPTNSARIMIALITKLVIVTAILTGILSMLLKYFGEYK